MLINGNAVALLTFGAFGSIKKLLDSCFEGDIYEAFVTALPADA